MTMMIQATAPIVRSRVAGPTCGSSNSGCRRGHRTAERHQPLTAQHQPAYPAVLAVAGIVAAERPLPAEPAIVVAADPQTERVHAFVEQLHARRATRIAADHLGAFGRCPARAP